MSKSNPIQNLSLTTRFWSAGTLYEYVHLRPLKMWLKDYSLEQDLTTYPEIGGGNFNITHSHFID